MMNRRTAGRTGRTRVDAVAARVRIDLAACYRLVAHFRMTDLIYTHISARLPGREPRFLINPYGLLFEEISASCLVTVALDGSIVDDPTGLGINPAGFVIHSAIHRARHDVVCVIHTHSAAGLAVAAQKNGLLPLTQHAMRFTDGLAYHDYEGVALDLPEQRRLVHDLGRHNAMILRNHGTLAVGKNVGECFIRLYYLERACQAQIMALSAGDAVNNPPQGSPEITAQQGAVGLPLAANLLAWPALKRKAFRLDPSFAT